MTNKKSRAGIIGLAVVGVLAAAWLLPPLVHQVRRQCPVRPDGVPEAAALAQFARRYGVDCTVCHTSIAQLTPAGYKFRVAGFRMPDEIGSDAKFSNWGDFTSVRLRETYKATGSSTDSTGKKVMATNGFSSSGVNVYPGFGAFGKYWGMESEISMAIGNTAATKGTVGGLNVSNANLRGTFPINADAYVGVRVGVMSGFEGYGAADRGIGLLTPSGKATASQVQPAGTKSFTYVTAVPSGEGAEVALDWKDTHVSMQILNGYNSFNGSANQGEDNYLKDYNLFIQQMIGENAISAFFYSGKTGYAYDASVNVQGLPGAEAASTPGSAMWINNYQRAAVYGTLKILPQDKLSVLAGFFEGKDHMINKTTLDGSDQFNSYGWFTTVQSVLHPHFSTALAFGTMRASTRTAGNRVSDVTLSLAAPYQNGKFALDFQTKRTQNLGVRDSIANTVQAEWMLNY